MNVHTAHILISRSCVNDCVFCAVARKRDERQFPDQEEIVRFIKDSATSGVRHLVFSGLGEPTLDPGFEKYLEVAKGLKFRNMILFTNGYGLTTEKATRWKDRGLSSVLLSMHGMEQSHDRNVQRKGSFSEAVCALEIYERLGVTITVNTCLTRLNLDEIPKLVAFLADYPLKMHTLSFPEWSGNAERFAEKMLDYREVSEVADELIPAGDTVTYFDNVPYCLVRNKIREMQGVAIVRLLDGSGDREFHPIARKLFPESCSERKCLLLDICPGFEKRYIAARGWQDLKERVNIFLEDLDDPAFREEIRSACSPGPRTRPSRPGEFLKSDPVPRNNLVFVIKPTSRCNAGCLYCSSRKSHSSPDMTPELVQRLYSEIPEYSKFKGINNLTFLWHGGEPLLLGKSFYASAWEESRSFKGLSIKHHIQSNLLLLDREWAELIKKFDVHLSTSVDPVGQDRVYKDGRPQYPDWMEKFNLACTNNLRIGIVFTVTPGHRDRVAEVYNFFKNIQVLSSIPVGVRVNPIYPAGAASDFDLSELLNPEEFGLFLHQLWELWIGDGMPFPLSPLKEWKERRGLSCDFSGRCYDHFIGVDSIGDIYHCGRFADTFSPWGNIMEDKLADILQHQQYQELSRREEALKEGPCQGCSYWDLCHGGCPYQAYLKFGEVTHPSPFCPGYKLFLSKSGLGMTEAERKAGG